MNSRYLICFFSLWFLSLPLPVSQKAYATLGEGADSVAQDGKALSAARKATSRLAGYSVQEITSDATTVREYVAPSGIVFAVAWNGMAHPDLTVLLGSYHAEYQNAKLQQSHTRGQKSTRVKSDSMVVETWGHMRNLQGRAYLPALVPTGVNLNEIH